jgi:beta-lactamase regulating signal transducer with metallopeptidase domain
MSTFSLDPVLSAAMWMALKASLLLGAAAVLQAVLHRRTSAAMRHLIWTLAMVGVLVLPVLSLAMPKWAIVTGPMAVDALNVVSAVRDLPQSSEMAPPSASNEEAAVRAENSAPGINAGDRPAMTGTTVSWARVMAGLYAVGAFLMLTHLGLQHWRIRRLTRRATDSEDREWMELVRECAASIGVRQQVRLLRSRESSMPMTIGTRRPAILLPAVADTWEENRRRAVLLHELAHVARRDCLTQSLALAARALYWFHPAAWWVVRRLRIERELACDDLVITAGAEARDYAGHLLEIAYSLGSGRAPALAVTMARRRQLEGRLLAALDTARNRKVPALSMRIAGVLCASALLLPLASASSAVVAVEPQESSSMSGVAQRPASQPESTVGPTLKALDWPIMESARRIVHAVSAAVQAVQERLPGTWEIRPTNTQATVHLRLSELNSSSGSNVPIESLEGLSASQLTGAGGPVQFRIRRDAGTLIFEGVVRGGVGAGTFTFSPDPNFPAELAKRGFARPTSLEQYQLARHDIGYAFVDELVKQGYAKPQTSELVRAGQHGVQLTYLREMGALGYRLGSLEPLITLRDHGVGPQYVRELAELGHKGLSADQLRQARDHGVAADYVRGMRDAGFSALTIEQLINARDHGVSGDDARELGALGFGKLPLEQLIRARDHGVAADYARGMRELGHRVPLDDLIRARDHGVDAEFARTMTSLGFASLPLDELIRMRDHGVTPSYVQALKALGYERLSVDDLVTLRDHGLTPERIRAANTRAGTRLPVDLLKNLAR